MKESCNTLIFGHPRAACRIVLSCFFYSFAIPLAISEVPASVTVAWLEDFNMLAEEIIRHHKPPGVAIAIVTPDRVLALKTKGVRQLGREEAIDGGTIFRAASLSKCCTSALAAQLSFQGRFDLEAPLVQYLPNVNIATPTHTQHLKVKDLLSHTSGLAGYSMEREAYLRQDFVALVSKLASARIVSKPGRAHQYQNVLFSLLGPVIENVTQVSFAQNLRKELLGPLGVTHCTLSEEEYAFV